MLDGGVVITILSQRNQALSSTEKRHRAESCRKMTTTSIRRGLDIEITSSELVSAFDDRYPDELFVSCQAFLLDSGLDVNSDSGSFSPLLGAIRTTLLHEGPPRRAMDLIFKRGAGLTSRDYSGMGVLDTVLSGLLLSRIGSYKFGFHLERASSRYFLAGTTKTGSAKHKHPRIRRNSNLQQAV